MRGVILALATSYLDDRQRRREHRPPTSKDALRAVVEKYYCWISPGSRRSDMEPQTTPSPWAKPEPGKNKTVELTPEVFRKVCKFAAKKGLMTTGKTPSDAIEAIFAQFRVEETS